MVPGQECAGVYEDSSVGPTGEVAILDYAGPGLPHRLLVNLTATSLQQRALSWAPNGRLGADRLAAGPCITRHFVFGDLSVLAHYPPISPFNESTFDPLTSQALALPGNARLPVLLAPYGGPDSFSSARRRPGTWHTHVVSAYNPCVCC